MLSAIYFVKGLQIGKSWKKCFEGGNDKIGGILVFILWKASKLVPRISTCNGSTYRDSKLYRWSKCDSREYVCICHAFHFFTKRSPQLNRPRTRRASVWLPAASREGWGRGRGAQREAGMPWRGALWWESQPSLLRAYQLKNLPDKGSSISFGLDKGVNACPLISPSPIFLHI